MFYKKIEINNNKKLRKENKIKIINDEIIKKQTNVIHRTA